MDDGEKLLKALDVFVYLLKTISADILLRSGHDIDISVFCWQRKTLIIYSGIITSEYVRSL